MARFGTFSKDLIELGAWDPTIQPDGLYDDTFENFISTSFPIVPIIYAAKTTLRLQCSANTVPLVTVYDVDSELSIKIGGVENLSGRF